MPDTFTFVLAVVVAVPIDVVSCMPVTFTFTLVPPREAIGDCDMAVIPSNLNS